MLPDALHTLRSVADHYATGTAKEAYGIAVFLVNQQRERRLLLHVLGYHLKVNRTLPVSSLTIWWQGMNLATTNQIQPGYMGIHDFGKCNHIASFAGCFGDQSSSLFHRSR